MSLTELPNDCVNSICPYLCFLDVYALRLSSVTIERKVDKKRFADFRRVVQQRLGSKCVDPDAVLKLLHQHQNYITGSFLLQCLLGEHWLDSDIDVLFHSRAPPQRLDNNGEWRNKIQEFIASNKEAATEEDEEEEKEEKILSRHVPQFLCQSHQQSRSHILRPFFPDSPLEDLSGPMMITAKVFEEHVDCGYVDVCTGGAGWFELTEVENLPFDFVQVGYESKFFPGGYVFPSTADEEHLPKYADVASYVEHESDLDFTKLLFDGDQRLSIYSINSLWSRSCDLSIAQFRILPYYHYDGPRSSQWDWTPHMYRHVRMRQRIDKYLQRGFRIWTNLPETEHEARKALRLDMQQEQHWQDMYDLSKPLQERNEDLTLPEQQRWHAHFNETNNACACINDSDGKRCSNRLDKIV